MAEPPPDAAGFHLALRAELAEMARLNEWVDGVGRALALAPSCLFALRLCAEELVANVVLHGVARDTGQITIRLHLCGPAEAPRLCVTDDGQRFDPTQAAAPAAPASLETARVGGRGLVLLRRFARELRYTRAEGENRIELVLAG